MDAIESDRAAGKIAKLADDAMKRANKLKLIVGIDEKRALVAAFATFAEAAAELAQVASGAEREVRSLRAKLGIAASRLDKAVKADSEGASPMGHVFAAETAVKQADDAAEEVYQSVEAAQAGAVDMRIAASNVR